MKKIFPAVCLFLVSLSLYAQNPTAVNPRQTTRPEVLKGFMDKRFGMFIHWGPVTLRGTEIGWSRGHEVPAGEYDNLHKEFNPLLFDAESWVKAAKDAGMKYIVITSKHHDGFCLWPSAHTDYDIMSSPYKKDVVGELAAACKKFGIAFCVYFTVLDWHDVNYPLHNLGDTIPDPKADMSKFVQTMKDELTELCSRYHPYMIWFDGNWEKPWTQEYGVEIYEHVKKLDPDVIINNRLGKGTHKVMNAETVGDYATPEQEIGKFDLKNPWESCITIGSQWSWKPNDKMKSLQECLQTLIMTACGSGNLLFNVGPMPDGRMEQRQVDRLREMGVWLEKYGESIYGTRGGPYTPNADYGTTRKGNTIYIHLFNPALKILQLPVLPGVKVLSASLMNGATANLVVTGGKYQITLPAQHPDSLSNVLVLMLDRSAMDIPVVTNP